MTKLSTEELLLKKLGFNRVKISEPLKMYTNWKIGGPADYLYIAENADELALAVTTARHLNIDYFILGLGANTLVSDQGFRGLVIVNKSQAIRFLPHDQVEVESGVNLAVLMKQCWDRNLYGLERMYKAPGTIGGGIFMNAGETHRKEYMGDLVISVRILDEDDNIRDITREDCEFTYRTSRFQRTHETILSARLQLQAVTKEDIDDRIKEILEIKKDQPPGPSGGSTFRNPPGYSIGTILDKDFGLKGYTIGGAKHSEKHVNFILNMGEAKAADVRALILNAKKLVKDKYGFEPEEEVRYLGEF